MPALRSLTRVLLAASAFAFLAACSDDEAAAPAGGAGAPPPGVSVVTIAPEALPLTNDLPGRIAPTRIAEVRPRVAGIIIERVFEQGSIVKEGDVLYRIDPEPFRVQVASARATLQRAEATQLLARQQQQRQSELRERNVASGQQFDSAVAALAQADADVASARAGLAAAELDLQYSEVKAPISGRIGRALITEGALVSSAGAENLATIQQLDPVYADFTQSASDLMALRRALELGSLTSSDPGEAKVQLILDDGTAYKHQGRLLFSEAAVDATTGQVTLRGEFPNPDGDLLPGMYVRVLIEQGVEPNAIAVPQQAVQRDGSGRAQVYVVGEDKKASLRNVSTGRILGNRWVINEGLKAGELVVVEGFQKIRPGAEVNAQPWTQQQADASAASETKTQ
ncbi:MexE family multidrug efflux RND transporter periplasmic adaptor subunit [Agaricicola taiwanensis]|uniref:MexE family multidrug efflux RND transporter periplasmic adaptor subunit n=1 Tax=Agaricicola taiwanensis TaxID=591372 RepID=A0A8J2YKR3_9RHOB|nr:efflux RND transporter periplasmic adaptor subunit [Agaricicola taiwanensis]GGE48531.1 MexE family multidrug efflux RND transporter periplasmic adaptor subunit [Agaricicola taiwanensis]